MIALVIAAVLHSGQTRFFLPDAVHTGDTVRCIVGARHIDARVTSSSGTDMYWQQGGLQIQIERHSNGSTRVACGVDLAPPFRRPTMPYVIGQNGLALLRGPNTLRALERVYGRPTGAQPGAGNCVVAWEAIGLHTIFRGSRCTSASVLVRADVSGARWSSLSGVHVGDSIGRLVWQVPTATRVSASTWRIATGAQYRSKLVAVVSVGSVVGFTATIAQP